jgi:hypothetical protein
MQLKINLGWAVEELQPRNSVLIAALKPGVMSRGQHTYARLFTRRVHLSGRLPLLCLRHRFRGPDWQP